MLATTGVSSFGGDFVLYPVINIVDNKLIEGGIKNFFRVSIELTLNVANISSGTKFSSEVWSLSGSSERVERDAIKNAFVQLKGTDSRFASFIDRTKVKICNYYASNKDMIFAKAHSLANTGEFEEAIAFLSSYPSQVEGFNEAQALMHKIYVGYVNANAARILNEARAAYATKHYDRAVNLAAQIGSESSYYNDAKYIINQVRATVNAERAEENRMTMQALQIAADVEKTRLNAEASVARAYYSRRVVNYTKVVIL